MREAFRSAFLARIADPRAVLLTGDLGFGALEPLRAAMGARFINAGVAEQNMLGVAAGMAKEGLLPWVYSIAPFLYARAFEQIRNDVVAHRLPVVMIGNGGGYGYGVMGATHHALEDYGVLGTLSELDIYVPAFARDVADVVRDLFDRPAPAYVRLGRCEGLPCENVSPFSAWRRIVAGCEGAIVAIGPLCGGLARSLGALPEDRRPSLWALGRFPICDAEVPADLIRSIEAHGVCVVEEHVAQAGVGASLSLALARLGVRPRAFSHRFARGYPSARYGSQAFHRRESGLDAESVVRAFEAGAT